jgi:hypothetical protein
LEAQGAVGFFEEAGGQAHHVMLRTGSTQKFVVPAPIAPYVPGVERWPK